MNKNWDNIYQLLFEKISVKNSPNYFSGPRFIKLVNKVDNCFPSFKEYIKERKSNKLSISRQVYFKDILTNFDIQSRNETLLRIINELNGSSTNNVGNDNHYPKSIEDWYENNSSSTKKIKMPDIPPQVFISYSWDNVDHKNWVLNLANELRNNGINSIIDQYVLKGGKNAPYFMEQSIEKSDKVLIIFTENYKLKAENRKGGVGYEYSILNAELYKKIVENEKYIPILRQGSRDNSIPGFMQQFFSIDMRKEDDFKEKLNELVLTIFNEPLIDIPEIGSRS